MKTLNRSHDLNAMATYLKYYLGETVQDLSTWDCEHLAMNILKELKIKRPAWWNEKFGLKTS